MFVSQQTQSSCAIVGVCLRCHLIFFSRQQSHACLCIDWGGAAAMQNVHVKEAQRLQRHCHTKKQLTCVFAIPRMEVCTFAWHIARCCMYHLASHLFLVLMLPVLGRDHREVELQTMVLLATATFQTQRHSFPIARQSYPLVA